jgi:hypothetical protein
MHQAIRGVLPQNSPKWKEYCIFQKEFLAEANRMRRAVRGQGVSLRTTGMQKLHSEQVPEVPLLILFVLGVADAAQGRGNRGNKRTRQKSGAAAPTGTQTGNKRQRSGAASLHADPVLQLRERIRANGLASGTYVQIENLQNEKWFMRIANGNVIDADGDNPALESALWCKPNSVVLCAPTEYPRQKCEIKTIMAAGPYSKFKKMLEST